MGNSTTRQRGIDICACNRIETFHVLSGTVPLRAAEFSYAQETDIGTSVHVDVICVYVFVLGIVQRILVNSKCRSLAL